MHVEILQAKDEILQTQTKAKASNKPTNKFLLRNRLIKIGKLVFKFFHFVQYDETSEKLDK